MVLHLRGKPKTEKKVQWGEEVVDNEFMGRKKSKCEWIQGGRVPVISDLCQSLPACDKDGRPNIMQYHNAIHRGFFMWRFKFVVFNKNLYG